tara:strand:- start:42 stop:278 length:237 start_codon:yes stop_codon:yes gene_type:complete
MKNDAFDRFGARLGKRFNKEKISVMLTDLGLKDCTFLEDIHYFFAYPGKCDFFSYFLIRENKINIVEYLDLFNTLGEL